MHQLGGQDLSGIGFGLGVDRTVLALRAEGKTAGTAPGATCSACRLARRPSSGWRCWLDDCARPGCGLTLPMVIAGSKARCARPLVPAPVLRW